MSGLGTRFGFRAVYGLLHLWFVSPFWVYPLRIMTAATFHPLHTLFSCITSTIRICSVTTSLHRRYTDIAVLRSNIRVAGASLLG